MTQHAPPGVLDRYAIGEVTSSTALDGGMFARPLLLESTTGQYVLRRQAFRRTERSFAFQAEVTNLAADRGVQCPRVVRCTDGAWSVRSADALWALHQYAAGDVLSWPQWCAAKQPDFLHGLGRRVAHLHDALAAARPSGDARLRAALPPIQFGRLTTIKRGWARGIRALATDKAPAVETQEALIGASTRIAHHFERLASAAAALRLDVLPRQIVHGDISPVNLVFTRDRSECSLIDWDCTHVGYRVYDALGDVVLRAPWDQVELHAVRMSEVRDYLNGYVEGAMRSVTPDEMACVPAFCYARQLEDLRQRLAVAPALDEKRDPEYAALVAMRLAILDQLAPLVDAHMKGEQWTQSI